MFEEPLMHRCFASPICQDRRYSAPQFGSLPPLVRKGQWYDWDVFGLSNAPASCPFAGIPKSVLFSEYEEDARAPISALAFNSTCFHTTWFGSTSGELRVWSPLSQSLSELVDL